jgi:hypothetical protein
MVTVAQHVVDFCFIFLIYICWKFGCIRDFSENVGFLIYWKSIKCEKNVLIAFIGFAFIRVSVYVLKFEDQFLTKGVSE